MEEEKSIKHVRIVYSELPPFVEILNGTDKVIGGFMFEIVNSIIQWMGLSSSWVREPEDKFGTWENNNWTGMCGMLFRNEVDLILNPLMPTAEFAEVAYFTSSITFEAYTFLTGKKKQDGGLFLYFSVLEPFVWLSMGVSLLVIAMTSALLYQKILEEKWGDWIYSFGQYLWVYVAYMLRQVPSNKWMLRALPSVIATMLLVLMMVWIIGVSFLVMTAFQTLLVSKLTIIKSLPIINSMEELLAKDIRGVTAREIELQEVLKDSGIPLYEKTWEKLEPELVDMEHILTEEAYADVEKGITCIVHGKLILKASLRDYFVSHGKCNFHLSENGFFAFPLLIGMRKSLPEQFKRKFDRGFLRLVGSDIIGKWFKSIYEECNLCTSYTENDLKPLQMKNIFGVMVIWAIGIFLSLLCFIVETFSKKRPSKKPKGHRNVEIHEEGCLLKETSV